MAFLLYLIWVPMGQVRVHYLGYSLTILRKYRRGFRYFLSPFLDSLHRLLGHEAAHPLGGILLHLSGDVGVGIQREARAVVVQDAGDCLGIYSLLDGQRDERVTQPVEGDVFGDACCSKSLPVFDFSNLQDEKRRRRFKHTIQTVSKTVIHLYALDYCGNRGSGNMTGLELRGDF